MKYQPVIGLEIHTELKTRSKMFCFCKNDPDEKRPNFNVCPICMAHPGTLPVMNKEAIRKVIKTGLALGCRIPEESKFDRKNYFYPDLPKGYQISQYDMPFCKDGYLEIPIIKKNTASENSQFPIPNFQSNLKSKAPKTKKIRIRRVHLEEDTGRLIHPEKADYSLVDFNRAGVPLMELVTEPDISSGREARKFAEDLKLILKYLGVSDADMEKGQLRVEVNISLQRKSQVPNPKSQKNSKSQNQNSKLGTKVEIKNLNSFRAVEDAIEYEIERQSQILDKKGKIVQETRGWNGERGETFSQREKEEAHDYRYFPEPDLPTIFLAPEYVREIKSEITELPNQKRKRMAEEYGLDEKSAEVFVDNKDLSEYFEKVASELREWAGVEKGVGLKDKEFKKVAKIASNYLVTDVQGMVGGSFVENNFKITPENFAEFIVLVKGGKITSKTAKEILVEMAKTGIDPSHIVEEKGLAQVTDEGEIEEIIKEVIAKNPKPAGDYRSGKQNALQFLAGKVMAATRGRAKPEIVQKLLKKILR